MENEKHRVYSAQQAAWVLIIGLAIGLFMNSALLFRWANQIGVVGIRNFFLSAIKPFHSFCDRAALTWPGDTVKGWFYTLAGFEEEAGWLAAADDREQVSGASPAATGAPAGVTPVPSNAGLSPGLETDVGPAIPGLETDVGPATPRPTRTWYIPFFTKQPAPLTGFIYSPTNPLKVLIIGDSMVADSLAPMFGRAVEGNAAIRYDKKSRYSSGLSRPDYYDWHAQVREIYSLAVYDLVIVMLGMNDAQDVTCEGRTYRYGTDEWFDLYRTRVNDFISLLLSGTKQVYWLGMPPMREPGYSGRMASLTRIDAEVCSWYARTRFISLDTLVTGADGKYTAHLVLDNRLVKVRSEDGKHLSQRGAGLVVDEIIKWIEADFTITNGAATGTVDAPLANVPGTL